MTNDRKTWILNQILVFNKYKISLPSISFKL